MEKVPMELDWDIPGQDALEEMIKDHRCKVCGHEAPEGSPELEFLKISLQIILSICMNLVRKLMNK